MTVLRQHEIEEILADLGMATRQCRIGAAIALCEAPWGPAEDGEHRANFGAIGDEELANDVWGPSYGGFQIRSLLSQKGTGGIRDADELLRPRFNCRSAKAIRKAWGGWGAWSTYTSRMFEAYLPDLYPVPAGIYVVLAGDTITGIADKLPGDWVWQDLARINGLSSPYTIYINQWLTLP